MISYTPALFFVSFISWETCGAHFNPAITIAQAIFNGKDVPVKRGMEGLTTIVAQFIGMFGGMFLSYLMSIYIYNYGGSNDLTLSLPIVDVMCPVF